MSDFQTSGNTASSMQKSSAVSDPVHSSLHESKSTAPNLQTSANNALDRIKSTSSDLGNAAADIANTSSESISSQATAAADALKTAASQAGDKLNQGLADGKAKGADYVSTLASAVRRAGEQFDRDLPIAGQYIRMAADQMDHSAAAIRSGSISDLVGSAQSFARSQPTAFLALSLVAGFGVVRFLKSGTITNSADETSSGG